MEIENFLKKARKMQGELVKYRRYLHKNAEIGFEIPKTNAFILKILKEIGLKPTKCGKSGIVTGVGKSAQKEAFLLRADVDALPINDGTGVSYACKTGKMHACGHDLHAAMLLGAAKLLKEYEKFLKCEVRFLFQPAEELLAGAKDCIQDGVLTGIKGAMMLHVLPALPIKSGTLVVSEEGVGAPAADYFTILVQGKGCHGASPQNGVDATLVCAKILLGLEEIVARELPPNETAALTVGRLNSGTVANAVAGEGLLEGTLRCFDEKLRRFAKKRIEQIAMGVAKAYRAQAQVLFTSGCPALKNDKKLSDFALKSGRELFQDNAISASAFGSSKSLGGSEDFAYIAQKVPSVMVGLTAGEKGNGFEYPLHHSKVEFDESVLWIGSAYMAYTALKWTQN